jgi:hypothetical protein
VIRAYKSGGYASDTVPTAGGSTAYGAGAAVSYGLSEEEKRDVEKRRVESSAILYENKSPTAVKTEEVRAVATDSAPYYAGGVGTTYIQVKPTENAAQPTTVQAYGMAADMLPMTGADRPNKPTVTMSSRPQSYCDFMMGKKEGYNTAARQTQVAVGQPQQPYVVGHNQPLSYPVTEQSTYKPTYDTVVVETNARLREAALPKAAPSAREFFYGNTSAASETNESLYKSYDEEEKQAKLQEIEEKHERKKAEIPYDEQLAMVRNDLGLSKNKRLAEEKSGRSVTSSAPIAATYRELFNEIPEEKKLTVKEEYARYDTEAVPTEVNAYFEAVQTDMPSESGYRGVQVVTPTALRSERKIVVRSGSYNVDAYEDIDLDIDEKSTKRACREAAVVARSERKTSRKEMQTVRSEKQRPQKKGAKFTGVGKFLIGVYVAAIGALAVFVISNL